MTDIMNKALDLLEFCHKTENCLLCGFCSEGICMINDPSDWGIDLDEYSKGRNGWHMRQEGE